MRAKELVFVYFNRDLLPFFGSFGPNYDLWMANIPGGNLSLDAG